jgi:hypothetical protein
VFISPGTTSPSLSDGGGATLASGPQSGPPMCNLGPNGGVCACVDQPLLTNPPNLYFVLDRSASMNEDHKWETIIAVLGQLVIDLGPRANLGAAVFPNPDGLEAASCSPGVEVFAPRRGDSPAGTLGPTADALLYILGHIAAEGGTPTSATLTNLASHIQSLPGKTYVILATDGGPNCNSGATCDIANCQLNIENAVGCPEAGPNCCTSAANGGSESCLDGEPTIAAVAALAAIGISVYVVGVPGSEPYAMLLDELATAGNTARGSEPQYYAVTSTDQAAFQAALFKIAATVTSSCTLSLNNLPPDPAAVNVFFDEQPIAQAGPDGWTLSGTTVTILGNSCAEMQNGDVLDVRVVAGCPTLSPR